MFITLFCVLLEIGPLIRKKIKYIKYCFIELISRVKNFMKVLGVRRGNAQEERFSQIIKKKSLSLVSKITEV